MNITRFGILACTAFPLVACGGGGGGSVSLPSLSVASSAATLQATEIQTQGNLTPVDDSRTNVSGYAITEGSFQGEEITSTTSSIVDGQDTVISVDGQTYTIANGQSVSNDGSFSLRNGSTKNGDYSTITSFELDGDAAVYVRGLATPETALPTGSASFTGDAVLTRSGSDDVDEGDFDMAVDFGANTLTGLIDVGGVQGEVNGELSGSGVTGSIVGDDLADMDMFGNFFGPNAEEFSGAASGQVAGSDAAVGLQAER